MKKYFMGVMLVVVLSSSVRAQIDSLLAIADTIPSHTEKIKWMLSTGYNYYTIGPLILQRRSV